MPSNSCKKVVAMTIIRLWLKELKTNYLKKILDKSMLINLFEDIIHTFVHNETWSLLWTFQHYFPYNGGAKTTYMCEFDRSRSLRVRGLVNRASHTKSSLKLLNRASPQLGKATSGIAPPDISSGEVIP